MKRPAALSMDDPRQCTCRMYKGEGRARKRVWHVSTYMMVVRVLGGAAPAETGDVVRLLYVARRIHHVC